MPDHRRRSGRFTGYSDAMRPSSIRALEALAAQEPDLISFGPGRPDDSLFPAAAIDRAYAEVLAAASAAHPLNYASTEGLATLRAWIAAREQAQGRRCVAANVLVTSGSQQAIHLVTRLLVEPGDGVAVQTPTYPGALQVFTANRARIGSIDEARRAPMADRPALIYAMADFQNPTGACLTLEERHELVALARRLDAVLLEDNAYEVLRYDGERLPRLCDIDTGDPDDGRTLYVGSFSKCAAPGLRLGWIVGPREMIARMALIKQAEDLQASTLSQSVIAHLGDYIMGRHAATLRTAYRHRRDRMLAALRSHMGNRAVWREPEGGFFVWLTVDGDADTSAALPEAIKAGVTYVPGSSFFHDGSGANHLRLSFSTGDPDRFEEGARRLATVL